LKLFSYVIKYKQGKENIVADALSRRYVFLHTMNTRLQATFGKFYLMDGYLFKENRLCSC
jgi:hypothetical protein